MTGFGWESVGREDSQDRREQSFHPLPPSPACTCWAIVSGTIAFCCLLFAVCHQGTHHGGPGSDLNHRQHPHPAQRLPPQEGSEAVMERKPVPELSSSPISSWMSWKAHCQSSLRSQVHWRTLREQGGALPTRVVALLIHLTGDRCPEGIQVDPQGSCSPDSETSKRCFCSAEIKRFLPPVVTCEVSDSRVANGTPR